VLHSIRTEQSDLCRRSWNLIFRAPQTVVNLTEEEVEKIMGYSKDHTRHGAGKDEVLRMLGNAFQV
jgi:hypothetical protein